jgi:hypothetical protein
LISNFARRVGPALLLASLGLLPGCASSRNGHHRGPELNPTVTGRPSFASGSTGYRVTLDVHLQQTDPHVEPGHTWTVRVWTSISDSDVVSQQQLDSIMMQPWLAARPDLNAGKNDVEIDTMEYGVSTKPKYYVVVVQAIEMTQDEFPEVYQEATYAKAFDNGSSYKDYVDIPPYSETASAHHGPPAQTSSPSEHAYGPVNPKISGRPNFGISSVSFDAQHTLVVDGTRLIGSRVQATVWGGYVTAPPPDPGSVKAAGLVDMAAGADQDPKLDTFQIEISGGKGVALQPAGRYFRIHVEVVETDMQGNTIDTAYLDHWFPTSNGGKPIHR